MSNTPPPQPPSQQRNLIRRPAVWLAGILVAALVTVVTSFLVGTIGNWFDTAKAADKLAPGDAVKIVSVDDYSGDYGMASSQIITDEQMQQVEGTASGRALFIRMKDFGAVSLAQQTVKVTLEGQRTVPVTITRMHPHVISCDANLNGTLVLAHPEGVDDLPHLETNLDDPEPQFTDAGEGHGIVPTPVYFDNHTITLAKNEVLTIMITAKASSQHCRYELQLDEIVDGSPNSEVLSSPKPLEVTGPISLDAYSKRFVSSFQYIKTDTSVSFTPVSAEWFCSVSCDVNYWWNH